MNHAEKVACQILDSLGISVFDDLLLLDEIIYARGMQIHECPIDGAEARLLFGPGKPIISISSSSNTHPFRRRFSIAHELGHFELHRGKSLLRSCTELDIQDNPINTSIKIEQEANRFASAFLIPERFVKEPFEKNEPSFDIISDWAKKLETSLTSTAFRFTEFTCEPVAVVYSYQGNIQYFHPSSEFIELGVFPNVKKNVGYHTEAKKLFSGLKIPHQWHKVKASEWFRENKSAFDTEDHILEWSIGMPSYEAVLSLLWVNEPLGQYSGW